MSMSRRIAQKLLCRHKNTQRLAAEITAVVHLDIFGTRQKTAMCLVPVGMAETGLTSRRASIRSYEGECLQILWR